MVAIAPTVQADAVHRNKIRKRMSCKKPLEFVPAVFLHGGGGYVKNNEFFG